MSQPSPERLDRMLLSYVRWLVRLRWVAAAGVVFGSLLDIFALQRYPQSVWMVTIGVGIALYNVLIWWTTRLPAHGRRRVMLLVWAQIVLDLFCLTVLAVWTGGVLSPVIGFFVFHMVFASLLLSRFMAYATAMTAIFILGLGLILAGKQPQDLGMTLIFVGWALTLLLTVYLANFVTENLRRQRLRLLRQNRRVRALAERLSQQQHALIQHEKMVATGQIAAGVAHEITNPLASIDSVLQLMQRNPKHLTDDKVASIREQVRRIQETVQQMTRYAHPTDYTWQTVPFNDLVDLGLQMVQFDKRFQKAHVDKQLTKARCRIRVQPHAVQQVLTNIVINALDAMADQPAPKLTIRTECGDTECRIEIADNGPGIAPEHVGHLFDPFFTTKPVGRGTGLGLAIAYNLMRKQGGRIEMQSKPGHGAVFTLVLPRNQQATAY